MVKELRGAALIVRYLAIMQPELHHAVMSRTRPQSSSRLYLLDSYAVAGDAAGLWDAENICIRASPGRMRASMRLPIRSAMLGGSESQRFADAAWVSISQSGS